MASGFFSMLLRMKYIDRWSLMRNTQRETLAEHTIYGDFGACACSNRTDALSPERRSGEDGRACHVS